MASSRYDGGGCDAEQEIPRVFNRGNLMECPVCQGLDPDPRGLGFCGLCGTVYRNRISTLLRFAKTAVALAIVLLITASIVTLGLGFSKLLGLALFLIGAMLLAAGLYFNRRVANAMLAALGLRTAPETMRFLRSTNRLNLFVLAFALLGLMAAVPYYLRVVIPHRQQALYQAQFASKMSEYLTLVPADAPVPEEATPYINGKILAIDKTNEVGAPSAVHVALPEELRAQSPEEVGTVVWVEWKETRFGTYGDSGIVAYRIDADVTVIDAVKKVVIARETFQGGDPPSTAPAGGGPGRGPRPVAKIVGYLEQLARTPTASESPAESS
jgi:hypothetical protein